MRFIVALLFWDLMYTSLLSVEDLLVSVAVDEANEKTIEPRVEAKREVDGGGEVEEVELATIERKTSLPDGPKGGAPLPPSDEQDDDRNAFIPVLPLRL